MGGSEEISITLIEEGRDCDAPKGSGGEGATSAQTVGNIVISILGTGVLGLPYAFRFAGWLSGSIVVTIVGIVIYYCMMLLIQCRKKVEQENRSIRCYTLGDLGATAFGTWGRYVTEFLVFISYAGGSVASLLFVGHNLSSLFTFHHRPIPPSAFVFLILLPVQVALSFIRSLSVLAPFSAFADVCLVLAIAIVLSEDVRQLRVNNSNYHDYGGALAFRGFWGSSSAAGVATFCYDGFGMTLALESSMAERRRFPWVLFQALFGVTTAYIFFGAFGYLAFVDDTRDVITLNLSDAWPATVVKVGLCIAIALSLPTTLRPINDIIETKMEASRWFHKLCIGSPSKNRAGLQAVRLLVIVILAIVATSVPGFTEIISFTGGTVCALLSFVLPAMFHLKLMGPSLTLWQRVVDYIVLCIGFLFTGYSTYAAISGPAMGS
ncbi:amino acid transporter ANT1-like [Typha angustifolia]|uniref:amino acid transporter ANT1-like n=1 Tax=Typha angustifolia TaxID=59011 RepID=UPI003C2ED7D9